MYPTIDKLVGETFSQVLNKDNEELQFLRADGTGYKLYHSQDCCESVTISQIDGDLSDLEGTPIVSVEENINTGKEDDPDKYRDEYHTWTFYHFCTSKGTVTVRWLGESNGYYSESVDFEELN